jgi:Rrf2 family protein
MSYSLAYTQAIVATLYVADKVQQKMFDFVPTKQLSEDLNIPRPSAVKILQALHGAGIIETREGARGGVRLAKAASSITLLDVFNAIENDRPLFRLDMEIRATGVKPSRAQAEIGERLNTAEEVMKNELGQTTIEDLIIKLNA